MAKRVLTGCRTGRFFAAASLVVLLTAAPSARGAERPVDFNRQIRPLLSDKCFACHGPDANKRDSDLRLDTKEGAFSDLGGRFAVVAGRPGESELVARTGSSDPDQIMPPPTSGKTLTSDQIALLRRWVAEGANWQTAWAYTKPQKKSPAPAAKLPPGNNAIDGFIRAKLPEVGLAPAAEADRVTLIRRLSFDLTGLPPTLREVEAFVHDPAADAYEKLVDHLLTSPHHGERMAMYWMDLVRYADTTGYHGDNHRDVSLYRDYVINAFNANKPFDLFTVEQIAGDLCPEACDETRVASGYNRMLMTTREGGAQPKEYVAKYAADRVRNASTVWLGATLGCAQCHDHKFDPYLTKDFYSFAAFFADIKEIAVGEQPPTVMPNAQGKRELQDFDAQLATVQKALDTQTPELDAAQAEWEKTFSGQLLKWTVLVPQSVKSLGGATLKSSDNGVITAGGHSPPADTCIVTAKTNLSGITAVRIEALPDPTLPRGGPGRAATGNFILNDFKMSVSPPVKLVAANAEAKTAAEQAATTAEKSALATSSDIVLENATADYSQKDFDVAGAIDADPKTGWGVSGETNKPHVACFELHEPLAGEGEKQLTFTLAHNHYRDYSLGRFRISVTTAPRPVRAGVALTHEVTTVLLCDPGQRTPEQRQTLSAAYRAIAPTLDPIRAMLVSIKKERENYEKTLPTTLVSAADEPRMMRVLPRGNWLDETGQVVNPDVPAFLPPLGVAGRRPTRLDLAHWMVSPENPLVARVFVNRLWKLMFGQGIVKTCDDFGAQGAAPTHPELLDWLALEFVDSGWNVRHMLRLMALSATYRQSSLDNPQSRQIDPYNRWLARQGRFRLDAEFLRDNALAVSGLLSPRVGGPSAKPYQPAGYWSHLNFPVREYMPDHGEDLYRRGLYTYWCRTFLHPSLAAFDAPSREECTVDRPRSNTPLQALVLLNDPTYVEAARVLAQHAMTQGGETPASRIGWAFRQTLSREATPAETELLSKLLEHHLTEYDKDPPSAERLLKIGESPVPGDLKVVELAAWTSVARVILNLHETITRN